MFFFPGTDGDTAFPVSLKKSANILSVQVRLLSAAKLNQRSGIHTETGFGVTVAMVVAERTWQHVSLMLAGAQVFHTPVDFTGR